MSISRKKKVELGQSTRQKKKIDTLVNTDFGKYSKLKLWLREKRKLLVGGGEVAELSKHNIQLHNYLLFFLGALSCSDSELLGDGLFLPDCFFFFLFCFSLLVAFFPPFPWLKKNRMYAW